MAKAVPQAASAAIVAALLLVGGCATPRVQTLSRLAGPPCASAGNSVAWFGPASRADRQPLDAWCSTVGPAVVSAPTVPIGVGPGSDPNRANDDGGLVLVTWNLHEGRGELTKIVNMFAPAHVVALVQEAVRTDDDRITTSESARPDIVGLADALGLWIAYVPSMRNGRDAHTDRGCAILSTLPLSEPRAVELPWVYQRRVAVMATVGGSASGRAVALRVVSVHLDNRTGRQDQAAALAAWLEPTASSSEPLIVGGDLNTWFGRDEQAVREVDRVVPLVAACDDRPTFRLRRRLDHLFATAAAHVDDCVVAADTYGSDHHPIVALVR